MCAGRELVETPERTDAKECAECELKSESERVSKPKSMNWEVDSRP